MVSVEQAAVPAFKETLMQLDHVNIHCFDQEAMRDFFVTLLGLEVGWRPSFKEPGYWLYLDGRPVLHTWPKTTPPGPGWVDHVAFGPCGDPDMRRAALERLGFPFHETRLPDTEIVQFFVTGPENIKVELQCHPTKT
jgi:catechol 2,3-dioxygenase-like lactoylglutathione lyase family enzyme